MIVPENFFDILDILVDINTDFNNSRADTTLYVDIDHFTVLINHNLPLLNKKLGFQVKIRLCCWCCEWWCVVLLEESESSFFLVGIIFTTIFIFKLTENKTGLGDNQPFHGKF